MTMTLYDCKPAPNPRRARMFLREKGLEFEIVEVDLIGGENLKPEFAAVNPRHTVPVLKLDDGTLIAENYGIAAYAEALKPEPALLGRTPEEKGAVFQWSEFAVWDGIAAVGEVFRNTSPGFAERAITGSQRFPQVPEVAERGKARVPLFFERLEARLQGRDFLASDEYTMADITVLCAVDFAGWIEAGIPEGNAATKAWYDRVASRPSAEL